MSVVWQRDWEGVQARVVAVHADGQFGGLEKHLAAAGERAAGVHVLQANIQTNLRLSFFMTDENNILANSDRVTYRYLSQIQLFMEY